MRDRRINDLPIFLARVAEVGLKKKDKGAKPTLAVGEKDTTTSLPLTSNDEIICLRNAHESEIIEKDIQIREANVRAERSEQALDAAIPGLR